MNRVFLIAALVFCGVIEAPGQQAGQQQAAQPKASPGKSAPADAKTGKTGGTDLFGGDSGERSKGPVEITAKQTADFDSRNRTAVFVGSVKVVDPQFTLTADKVTVVPKLAQIPVIAFTVVSGIFCVACLCRRIISSTIFPTNI